MQKWCSLAVDAVFFCSAIKTPVQQICIVGSTQLVRCVRKKLAAGGEQHLLLGSKNIRMRLESEKQMPHRKITVKVADPNLAVDRSGAQLRLAMQLKLIEHGEDNIQLLRGQYVGKTSLFEFTLSGDSIPDSLRKNSYLVCCEHSMIMSFRANPCVMYAKHEITPRGHVLRGRRTRRTEHATYVGRMGTSKQRVLRRSPSHVTFARKWVISRQRVQQSNAANVVQRDTKENTALLERILRRRRRGTDGGGNQRNRTIM